MDPSSLSTHKSSFLLTQTRLLSSPLHPSPALTSTFNQPSTPLPPTLLSDLLARINTKITQHNKSVFPAQTQRHIVEQIESLYFSEALADDPSNIDPEQGEELLAIERDADLSSSATTAALPEELHQCMLHDISDLSMDETQADEYYTLRRQLTTLSAQRDAARQKVQRYEKLRDLMRPFEDAQEGVQPNLVTRDGEMAREMERMRALVARVAGRMGEVDSLPERKEWEDGERRRGFDEKLRIVMDMDTT